MCPHETLQEFNEVIAFEESLNNEIYNTPIAFTSIDEVYQLTNELQQQQRWNGHLCNLCRLQPYLDRAGDYMKVPITFIQMYSQSLALDFGPVKLLGSSLADIGAVFPVFSGQMAMFSRSERIQRLYVLLFKNILDFYQMCLEFFSMSGKHGMRTDGDAFTKRAY